MDFMAVEALKQRYLIMPDPLSLDVGTLPVKQLAPLSLEPEPPFENNCGHDVESLLWLALFMLLFKMDIVSAKETKPEKENRRNFSAFVFPCSMLEMKSNRHDIIFRSPRIFLEYVQRFCDSFKDILSPLVHLVVAFKKVYAEFEATIQTGKKPEVFKKLIEFAIDIFRLCRIAASNVNIESYEVEGRNSQHRLEREQSTTT